MKPAHALTGAIIAGSVAVAAMFAAAPAAAATLPAGAKITVIDAFGDQFYNANPATAVATPVGTPTPVAPMIQGVDVDDTGHGYAVGTLEIYVEPEEGDTSDPRVDDEAYLYKADANTGALTEGKQVRIDDGGEDPVWANECSAIDYSGGVIIAVCYSWGNSDIGYVGVVDPSGEDAVLAVDTILWEQDGNFHYFTAIALDPTDGTLYGFDLGRVSSLWTITLDNADPELVEDQPLWYVVHAADFDRGGQLWLSVIEEVVPSALNETYVELATFDFDAFAIVPVDYFSSEDPYEIDLPGALTVWGVLASTGSSVSLAPAVAASGVLLLGAILAAGTMVLRRRSADA